MGKFKRIDEKIRTGYRNLKRDEIASACNAWLDAWEDIKNIMKEENIPDISALESKYKWSEFLYNYVQDLDQELWNAGLDSETYFSKRIIYCEEMLKLIGTDDTLLIENTRRSIADSHYALGNTEECDRLYRIWLAEDPKWTWGYIGWADCYTFEALQTPANFEKAGQIISKALEQKDIEYREDVVMRASEIYAALGQTQKVEELEKELDEFEKLQPSKEVPNTPVKVEKVGRNDPCPCGSRKKYKKCCGA